MRAWDCLLAFPGMFLAVSVVAVLDSFGDSLRDAVDPAQVKTGRR